MPSRAHETRQQELRLAAKRRLARFLGIDPNALDLKAYSMAQAKRELGKDFVRFGLQTGDAVVGRQELNRIASVAHALDIARASLRRAREALKGVPDPDRTAPMFHEISMLIRSCERLRPVAICRTCKTQNSTNCAACGGRGYESR